MTSAPEARLLLFACLSVLLFATKVYAADELEMLNGQRHRGRLLSEDDQQVQFEVISSFGRARMPFDKDKIHRIGEDGRWRVINAKPEPEKKPPRTISWGRSEPRKKEPPKAQRSVVSPAVPVGGMGFRNNMMGHFPNADPPVRWNHSKNLAWNTALPDKSISSPIVVGDRVFVVCEPDVLLCVERTTGKILWQKSNDYDVLGGSASGRKRPSPNWISTYGYTTPTPVSDGRSVWCAFGHGVAVCYDLEGNRRWAAEFDADNRVSGCAVSPCLAGNVLVCGGKGRCRFVAFDAATGKRLWSKGGGGADGSCVPVQLGGQWYVVTANGKLIEARSGNMVANDLAGGGFQGDPENRPSNWGPTPSVVGNVAYFHWHFKPSQNNGAIRAVRLNPNGNCEQLWSCEINTDGNIRGRMAASHLVDDGLVYAVKDNGELWVIDAADGSKVYTQKLPKQSWASLAKAGPYIYAFGKRDVTVFQPGRSWQQVAQFKHGFGKPRASPVFVGTCLFFRDDENLYCIVKR